MITTLEARLAERTIRIPTEGAWHSPSQRVTSIALHEGAFILYWMRMAVRCHENPALDLALELSRASGLPVFVYHALSERYRYASDRHHQFILEGARDVAEGLAQRGIGYAFHLEREGHRGDHLVTLAMQAACVITELVPTDPTRRWTSQLAKRIAPKPVFAVDASCIVPMPSVDRAFDRAFEFRNATRRKATENVSAGWRDAEVTSTPFVPALPFTPFDFRTMDEGDVLAACDIDHGIAPIADSPGGSRAGYARWEVFQRNKLVHYARDRNDPLRDPSSRLSAYLHYGYISPFRIAKALHETTGEAKAGADKLLDELLIWREAAWHDCFHHPDHMELSSLPTWAKETLKAHESDARTASFTWEPLAHGESGNALWDACQQSLVRHGELHNNVRMTWGKALLEWTPNAAHALALLQDLNDRYALDGRDPSSYGGIRWCFGHFDKPFSPELPILGTVRPRPLAQHADRLDVPQFKAFASRSPFGNSPRVAVVGAGVAGLACARALYDHGLDVTVFEKSRGSGGRLASRRVAAVEGLHLELRFHHGAQHFQARKEPFQRFAESWAAQGLIDVWPESPRAAGDGSAWYAPTHEASLTRHLARGLAMRANTRVTALKKVGTQTEVHFAREDASEGREVFDIVLITVPAPQASPLLEGVLPELASLLSTVVVQPTWAVMLAYEGALEGPKALEWSSDSTLSWLRQDAENGFTRLVLHASHAWSRTHLEASPEFVIASLEDAARAHLTINARRVFAQAHRWRFSRVEKAIGQEAAFDREAKIGAAGDAFLGSRIESAWQSGRALAGLVMRDLAREGAPERRAPMR